MALSVKRLGGTQSEPLSLEIKGFSIGPVKFLVHMEKLPTVKVTSKWSYPLTDDVWASFEYKDYVFRVDSPFAYLWVTAVSQDIPEAVFAEVENHIINYRRVWPHQAIWGFLRYLFLFRRGS